MPSLEDFCRAVHHTTELLRELELLALAVLALFVALSQLQRALARSGIV